MGIRLRVESGRYNKGGVKGGLKLGVDFTRGSREDYIGRIKHREVGKESRGGPLLGNMP